MIRFSRKDWVALPTLEQECDNVRISTVQQSETRGKRSIRSTLKMTEQDSRHTVVKDREAEKIINVVQETNIESAKKGKKSAMEIVLEETAPEKKKRRK